MRIFAGMIRAIAALLPEGVVAKISPNRPVYRGHMIAPKAYAVSRVLEVMRPPGSIPNAKDGRKLLRGVAKWLDIKVPLLRIEDLEVEGANGPLKARLFTNSDKSNRPAIVYFHGGGFVQGDIESHHHTCAKLAKWSGYTVISVDYRLAPEHPFPAAPDDCLAAFCSIIKRAKGLGIDPENTGVAGDSAGGCLAAVTAQQLAAHAGPCAAFQVLIYPVVDGNLATLSLADMTNDPVLPTDVLDFFLASYLGSWTNKNDPRFSPIFGTNFAAQPEAYILTGGFDPLQDDGKMYADALKAAGVGVTHRHFPGQIHGFISITRIIPQGVEALHSIADWLKARA